MESLNHDFDISHLLPTQESCSTTLTASPVMHVNMEQKEPYLRIVEQPAKLQRFRYAIEGLYAISPLKGVNWTLENYTYPTIEICNYEKPVVVVISCVTSDEPHRPHPYKVVGRNRNGQKYENGVGVVRLNEPPFRATLNFCGIHIVKRKDMEASLEERRKRKVNPFNTTLSEEQSKGYDLHEVRLCFQAFINPTGMPNSWQPLKPVLTDIITDRRNKWDLEISQLCNCTSKASGGERNILLCNKVDKNDIKVKFTEFDSQGYINWQVYADFEPQDVHKQSAIVFKTPRYKQIDISAPIKVFVQLERISDRALSKPVQFHFYPDNQETNQ